MNLKYSKTLISFGVFALLVTLMISVETLKNLGQRILSQPAQLNNTKQPGSHFLQGKPAFAFVEKANAYLFSALKHIEPMSHGDDGRIEPNNRSMLEQIVITGWYFRRHISKNTVKMMCCFYHNDGRFSSGTGEKRETRYENRRTHFNAMQYICLVYTTNPVIKISLTEEGSECSTDVTHYIDVITIEKRTVDGVALFAKVLYGTLNARFLVEWFEAQRFPGVEKIFCYIHGELNNAAKKVVKYYEEMGLAKSAVFEIPENDTYPRRLGDKKHSAWTDAGVTVLDWQERMTEYKYAIHLDTDELLIPDDVTLQNSLKRYLTDRFQSNKALSLMYFLTMVHMTSWDATNPDHELFIGRQSTGTIAMRDRQKYAFKPEGVVPGSCTSHRCRIKNGYNSKLIRDNSAVIHHFRSCRPEWKKEARKSTMKHRQLFIDNPQGILCDNFKRLRRYGTCNEGYCWRTYQHKSIRHLVKDEPMFVRWQESFVSISENLVSAV